MSPQLAYKDTKGACVKSPLKARVNGTCCTFLSYRASNFTVEVDPFVLGQPVLSVLNHCLVLHVSGYAFCEDLLPTVQPVDPLYLFLAFEVVPKVLFLFPQKISYNWQGTCKRLRLSLPRGKLWGLEVLFSNMVSVRVFSVNKKLFCHHMIFNGKFSVSPTSKLQFISHCLFDFSIVNWTQNLLVIYLSWVLTLCISEDRCRIPLLSKQYFSKVKNWFFSESFYIPIGIWCCKDCIERALMMWCIFIKTIWN